MKNRNVAEEPLPVKINAAGFNAYVVSDPSSKMVYVCAIIRSGYYNESPDAADHESGINHLFEHVLINSWHKCNKKPCALLWNNRRVEYNASTQLQYVEYHITGLDSETADMVNYITQIIDNPRFDSKIIEAEKAAVLNELKIIQNNPVHKLTHALFSCVYSDRSGLRNQTNIQMQIDNLKHITVADIAAYHKRFYTPKNITFFFAGNITKAAVISALNRNMNMAIRKYPDYSITIDECNYYLPAFRVDGAGKLRKQRHQQPQQQEQQQQQQQQSFPIFIENPEAKNTTFTIIIPVFQPSPTDVVHTEHFYLCAGIVGVELNSMLRTKHHLVYGVMVQAHITTSENMLLITGSCIDKNVRRIFTMCLNYIAEHQHPNHLVPEKIIYAEKGRFAIAEHSQVRTSIQLAETYKSFFMMYAKMNGSVPLAELNVPFVRPKMMLHNIETASAVDMRKMFQMMDVSKAVYGYIGKHKQYQ